MTPLVLAGDLPTLLCELQNAYSLGHVRIQVHSRPPLRLLENTHASAYKASDGWVIEVVNGGGPYLLFHEFLHIALEESGRFIEFAHRSEAIGEYLFGLKLLMDEYLIETEVKRRFGPTYRRAFADHRVRSNLSFQLLSESPSETEDTVIVRTFMELLSLSSICTHIYPSLKNLPAARVLRNFIRSPRFDSVVAILAGCSFSATSAAAYATGVARIHAALTVSSITFTEEHVGVFDSARPVEEFIRGLRRAQVECARR